MPFDTTKGPRVAYVAIDDVSSDECPVSRLTRNPADESRDLVNIFSQTEAMQDLQPMGSAEKWPSAWLDAYLILKREKSRHDNAQQVAAQKAL